MFVKIRIYLFILAFLFVQRSYAQVNDSSRAKKSHFEISLMPILLNRLQINDSGAKYLKSHRTISGQLDLNYIYYLKRNWALKCGTGASVFRDNYYFDYPYRFPGYSPNRIKFSVNDYLLTNIHLNFSIEKTIKLNKSCSFLSNFGIRLNRYEELYLKSGVGNFDPSLDYFTMSIYAKPRDFLLSYFGDIGLIYRTKKRADQFSISLYFNYSPEYLATGNFQFFYPADLKPSYGTLKYGINSLGIKLTTRLNRIEIKKKSPTELKIENSLKGIYLGFQTSFYNDFFKYEDSGNKIKSVALTNFSWGIFIKHDIGKNFRVAIDYKKKNYMDGYGLKNMKSIFDEMSSLSMNTLQFGISLDYKFNILLNKLFLIPALGYEFCINNDGIGTNKKNSLKQFGDNLDSIQLSYTTSSPYKKFSLIKSGLGLDIRLFNNTLLNLTCNYFTGFKSVLIMDMQYQVNHDPLQYCKVISKGNYIELNACIIYKFNYSGK